MQALVTKDNVTISQEDKIHEGEYMEHQGRTVAIALET